METKQKYAVKTHCSCEKIGVCCLASCVWAIVIRRGARQNSIVFISKRERGLVSSCSSHVDVWVRVFIEKTKQTTKHVLHMFCERTGINSRHVACQWRGTAFSRNNCVFAYIAAWRVTPSFSFSLWSLLSTHNSASRALESTSSLARHEKGQDQARAQKNNLRVFGPNVSLRG